MILVIISDQARQAEIKSGFKSKLCAEAKKEKVSERLRHLQSQLTDQYRD